MKLHSFILLPMPEWCGELIIKKHRKFVISYPGVEMEILDIVGVNCKIVSDIWYRIMNLREECFEKPYNNENLLEATYICSCYEAFKVSGKGQEIPKQVCKALKEYGIDVNPLNAIYLQTKLGFFEGMKYIADAEFKRVNSK